MSVLREYRRARRAGRRAKDAMDRARVVARWEWAEYAGLVELTARPDCDCCMDDLEGDCFSEECERTAPGGRRAVRAQRKAFRERVDADGVWGLVGRYRLTQDGPWVDADSVWGFVGEEWRDSGYDGDIMRATLDGLRGALRDRVRVALHADGRVSRVP